MDLWYGIARLDGDPNRIARYFSMEGWGLARCQMP